MDDVNSNARMLRVVDAAQLLGVSASYLNKLRQQGGGPTYRKLGHSVVYHPDDLQAWLETKRRTSTAEGNRE